MKKNSFPLALNNDHCHRTDVRPSAIARLYSSLRRAERKWPSLKTRVKHKHALCLLAAVGKLGKVYKFPSSKLFALLPRIALSKHNSTGCELGKSFLASRCQLQAYERKRGNEWWMRMKEEWGEAYRQKIRPVITYIHIPVIYIHL